MEASVPARIQNQAKALENKVAVKTSHELKRKP